VEFEDEFARVLARFDGRMAVYIQEGDNLGWRTVVSLLGDNACTVRAAPVF
jgi:hypothetical protein